MHVDETIVAIASCPYGGLRGIVRVTGPDTVNCLRSIFRGNDDLSWWQVGRATRIPGAVLLAPPLGDAPCDLFLWPTERSYTRQPTAELHTLGASPLLQAVMKTVCQQGARLARPGEFTLRAFLAGRLDLAQAEAVLGVIDAVDDRQLEVALAQLAGGLSGPLTTLRDTLLNLCADLEAGLDFVDEDIQFISTEQLDRQLHAAQIGQQLLKSANRVAQGFSTLGDGLEAERGILGRFCILRRRILTRFKSGRLGQRGLINRAGSLGFFGRVAD